MDKPFRDWLAWEATERDWSLRELSRRARISHASVSNVLSGVQQPTAAFCDAIAHAFDLPQEEVFRRAGLLDPKPAPTILTDRLLAIAAQLSEDEMRDLLDYAELIKRRRKRKSAESG